MMFYEGISYRHRVLASGRGAIYSESHALEWLFSSFSIPGHLLTFHQSSYCTCKHAVAKCTLPLVDLLLEIGAKYNPRPYSMNSSSYFALITTTLHSVQQLNSSSRPADVSRLFVTPKLTTSSPQNHSITTTQNSLITYNRIEGLQREIVTVVASPNKSAHVENLRITYVLFLEGEILFGRYIVSRVNCVAHQSRIWALKHNCDILWCADCWYLCAIELLGSVSKWFLSGA